MAQNERRRLDTTFKQWMRESKFKLRGCDIMDFPETGRGVVATSDLPESHVLFSVPRECVLSAANSIAAEALQKAGITGWEALIIAIVVEMAYGRRSQFWPYLEALPRHLDTPVLWEEDELALLRGSATHERLGRDEVACTIDTLMLPFLTDFFRAHGGSFNAGGSGGLEDRSNDGPSDGVGYARGTPRRKGSGGLFLGDSEVSRGGRKDSSNDGRKDGHSNRSSGGVTDASRFSGLDERRLGSMVTCVGTASVSFSATKRCCYHVGALVSAYSFTLEDGQPAMVPFADFLNHKTGHNNARLHYNGTGRPLQMITTQPVKAGSELFNTYGDLSNAELLRKYAFVDDASNPHNCVEIPATAVLTYFYDRVSEAACRAGGPARPDPHVCLPPEGDANDETIADRGNRMSLKRQHRPRGLSSCDHDGPDHGNKEPEKEEPGGAGKGKGKRALHDKDGNGAMRKARASVDGGGDASAGGDGGRITSTVSPRGRATRLQWDVASMSDEWDIASINDKAALLEEVGIMPPDHVFQIPRDGSPPPDLVESIRVFLMCTGPGRGCFRALHRSLLLNRMPPPQPLWRLDGSVAAAIAGIARERLSLLPFGVGLGNRGTSVGAGSSGPADVPALEPGTHAWRCLAAAAVVQGEREILERLVANMEADDTGGPPAEEFKGCTRGGAQGHRARLESVESLESQGKHVRRNRPVAVTVGPAVWPALGGRHAKLAAMKEAAWWRCKRRELAGH
eukprot:jgi/Mesvir1/13104/Mv06083-RA.1